MSTVERVPRFAREGRETVTAWLVLLKTRRARLWRVYEAFLHKGSAEARRRELASKWPDMQLRVGRFEETQP